MDENVGAVGAFLEVSGIKKSFGAVEVLKGIDFTLKKGEVLAIIGSSGSGKTTLLRCINFLEIPDSGSVTLDGVKLMDIPQRTLGKDELIKRARAGFTAEVSQSEAKAAGLGDLRGIERIKANNKLVRRVKDVVEAKTAEFKNSGRYLDAPEKTEKIVGKLNDTQIRHNRLNFGLVFQQFNLFPQYNALTNVVLAAELLSKDDKSNMYGKSQADIRADAVALLERVGLGDKLSSYPCELSGGQQQRVAIARALALHPSVLCFDEPTSALDPELTGEVLRVIRSLKSSDRTMIVVTHEMEFARSVADKVIFMADGVVEEVGTPEEVFGAPKSQKAKAFLDKREIGEGI